MRKELSGTQLVIRLIAAVIAACICIGLFRAGMNALIDGHTADISDGWDVIYQDHTDSDVDLYHYKMDYRPKRGDTIVLERTLPNTIGQEVVLTFDAELSAVSVNINGSELYSYGFDLIREKKIPGSASHMVQLPDYAAGSVCRVTIKAGMDNAYYVLPAFYLIPSRYETASYMSGHRASALAAIFLFAMGVTMLLVAIIMGFIGRRYTLVFAIGAMSFGIGVWTLCSSHIIELFSTDYAMNTRLEYVSLYMSVIPLVAILYLIRGSGKKKWQQTAVSLSLLILIIFACIVTIADVAGIRHPATFILVSQVVIFSGLMLMIAGTFRRDGIHSVEDRICTVGLAILFTGCVYDIVRYYVTSHVLLDNRLAYISVIPFVAVIFIFLMVAAYLVRLHRFYMHEAEKEIIDQLAFTDAATGLKNRTYSNHIFEELEHRKTDSTFQVISFDINGLSKVNETLGRAAGDQLILDCANIIKTAFTGVGEVIRMGGDEFMVLTSDGHYRDVKHALSRMERLERTYELKRKYEIGLSYGIASSDEKEGLTPEAVYHRANERMYAKKKEKYVWR